MPALPDVPFTARTVIKQSYSDGTPVVNVMHWTAVANPPPGAMATLGNAVSTAWIAHILPNQNVALSLQEVQATDLSSTSGEQYSSSAVSAGTADPPYLPAGLAVVAQERISRRYRGGHGRIYLSGLRATILSDSNTINLAAQEALQAEMEGVKADVELAVGTAWPGCFLSVVSYYQGFVNVTNSSGRTRPKAKLREGGPVVDGVEIIRINPQMGSQRRRNQQ